MLGPFDVPVKILAPQLTASARKVAVVSCLSPAASRKQSLSQWETWV